MAWARTLPTAAGAVKLRFGSGRRLKLGAGRHAHPGLALEHHGRVDCTFADEPGTLAGIDQFSDPTCTRTTSPILTGALKFSVCDR